MKDIRECASLSEMVYRASQAADMEVIEEVQMADNPKESIVFDVSPLIDLALDTKDEEWFYQLTLHK